MFFAFLPKDAGNTTLVNIQVKPNSSHIIPRLLTEKYGMIEIYGPGFDNFHNHYALVFSICVSFNFSTFSTLPTKCIRFSNTLHHDIYLFCPVNATNINECNLKLGKGYLICKIICEKEKLPYENGINYMILFK